MSTDALVGAPVADAIPATIAAPTIAVKSASVRLLVIATPFVLREVSALVRSLPSGAAQTWLATFPRLRCGFSAGAFKRLATPCRSGGRRGGVQPQRRTPRAARPVLRRRTDARRAPRARTRVAPPRAPPAQAPRSRASRSARRGQARPDLRLARS